MGGVNLLQWEANVTGPDTLPSVSSVHQPWQQDPQQHSYSHDCQVREPPVEQHAMTPSLTGWQSDTQFLSLSTRYKRKFPQNRGSSELRTGIEWQHEGSGWKVKMTQRLPNNALTASSSPPTWFLQQPGWEDQPLDVSTLYYYSLGNCNSLASPVSPPGSQAFQWLDSKPLKTFCFTVWCAVCCALTRIMNWLDDLFVSPIFMVVAGWRYHYYLLTAAKCPASPW